MFTHSFGWVNASYVYGLTIVSSHARRALGTLTPFETWHNKTNPILEVSELSEPECAEAGEVLLSD